MSHKNEKIIATIKSDYIFYILYDINIYLILMMVEDRCMTFYEYECDNYAAYICIKHDSLELIVQICAIWI